MLFVLSKYRIRSLISKGPNCSIQGNQGKCSKSLEKRGTEGFQCEYCGGQQHGNRKETGDN